MMKQLMSITNKDHILLRSRAIECAGIIAAAVGKEAFAVLHASLFKAQYLCYISSCKTHSILLFFSVCPLFDDTASVAIFYGCSSEGTKTSQFCGPSRIYLQLLWKCC
jgi:hypothetical protein